MTAASNIATDATSTKAAANLRQKVDEFVGLFFYGTLLKGAREHKLTNSKVGFGGRGEEAFGAQLDQELAQRAGGATHHGLNEAIFRQLQGKMAAQAAPAAPASSMKASPATGRTAPDCVLGSEIAEAKNQSGIDNPAALAAKRPALPYQPARAAGQKLDIRH